MKEKDIGKDNCLGILVLLFSFGLFMSFGRAIFGSLITLWFVLISITKGINFNDENDHIVWSFRSSGKYSVKSLYMINHMGIVLVYIEVVWKITIPLNV